MLKKQLRRQRIHKKIRSKIFGTKECPRLCVFKSDNHIYAQLINDDKSVVLVYASDKEVKKTGLSKDSASKIMSNKVNYAFGVGKLIATKAQEKKIDKVVFDRGGFVFHGRIKALADGAREGGLKF